MAICLSEIEEQFFTPSMAESVTRHALIPFEEGYEFLLCGIDSLDLGGYIEWDSQWPQVQKILQLQKERAQGTDGLLCNNELDRNFIFKPGGKAPQYRYHLQYPEYHLFIGITNPPRKSPNVYVSLNSEAIWHLGVAKCVDLVTKDIECFGGNIQKFQVSRIDLAADFYIPGDFCLPFLDDHKITRSRDQQHYISHGQLETFYVGAPGSPIRLRIYDKGKEVVKSGKLWFLSLWGRNQTSCVWRVEYQLRRNVLKQFKVETVDDLQKSLGGLWRYLTADWFSLRLPQPTKQERREIHRWWKSVANLANHFGPTVQLQRITEAELLVSLDWYVAHIAGCLPSMAARMGTSDLREVLSKLQKEMCSYWFEKNFQHEYAKRAIRLGKHPKPKEERYAGE